MYHSFHHKYFWRIMWH